MPSAIISQKNEPLCPACFAFSGSLASPFDEATITKVKARHARPESSSVTKSKKQSERGNQPIAHSAAVCTDAASSMIAP